jgi:hypothetical protein
MALYFFDSSALGKRYVHAQGSGWVREITASASSHLSHISLLTVAEITDEVRRQYEEIAARLQIELNLEWRKRS